MDSLSLGIVNRLSGAQPNAAGIEFGPGPASFEVVARCTISFGGAPRDGAPWWRSLEVENGQTFELSSPREGNWSYLALEGGIDAPVIKGSRSTNVREGIGDWLKAGDVLRTSDANADPEEEAEGPPMQGPVRIYGDISGEWRVGTRTDRMGYQLDGGRLRPGRPDEWSEPVLPGFVQVLPSGLPIVLMPEGSTVGGYPVAGAIHSEDLRLVAQTRPGDPLRFVGVV
jgi:allophanate hydrolase subunit 2